MAGRRRADQNPTVPAAVDGAKMWSHDIEREQFSLLIRKPQGCRASAAPGEMPRFT